MTTTIELKPTSEPLGQAQRAEILADPGFGRHFTDHMVMVKYTEGRGWHDAQLRPYGPIEVDPATAAVHYGQEIFEGLKAYRQQDGGIASFRPRANAARLNRSARRMGMPQLPEELFIGAIDALVKQDAAWVPDDPEKSLYLRPFMFATEIGLGVNRPAGEYLFMLIASPAGSYFSGGIKPVKVWLCEDFTRAAAGGTGEAKCAGNYAASFVAQAQAVAEGCDQVCWLDAVERSYVEEMGSNNVFFVYGSGDQARLLTPELSGSLLPGITRDSLLQAAADLGIPAAEGRITVEQWRADAASGAMSEAFGCGTAAVVTPIGSVKSKNDEFTVADGNPGPVTLRLREHLLGIQRGAVEDKHGWLHKIEA
ncbi:branched-chain amino acid aminotransferase [Actinocrinis puniceicyclus]|uniref:Branched-chain-amino-acid aminotransferase n=1 Tax=Actinocrinis puniceicyclus TaxID=977794 RepID=A0A8J7WL85_9ACTN|nr:branched-chain amino acid aminotransferase [Actinocrinis puniceicyclus]MBS2961787.1 branched-chain amino acid aminotransferase [Actinocrinis puniceicyclus]